MQEFKQVSVDSISDPLFGDLSARSRGAIAWTVLSVMLALLAIACTTIRVPNSLIGVFELQMLVLGLLLVSVACIARAFGVVRKKSLALTWLFTISLFVGCVVLT